MKPITPRVQLTRIPGKPAPLSFAKEYPDAKESSFQEQFYKLMFADVEHRRLMQIEDRLAAMGYRFGDMFMLKEFLKQNATIITYPDKPNYREMYLFAGTSKQATVGSWWETYEFVPSFDYDTYAHKMTVIAGRPGN